MTIRQITLLFVAIATPIIAMDRDHSGKKGPKPCPNNVRGPRQVTFVNTGVVFNAGDFRHHGPFINTGSGVVVNSGTWNSGNIPNPQYQQPFHSQHAQPRHHSNTDPEVTERMRRLHYPTPVEVTVANEQIQRQDNKISRLQTLALSDRQQTQLKILQTLKGDERVTVGDIILQQYDNNPEIQTKIAEQEKSFFSEDHHSPHFTEYYLPHPKTGEPVLLGYCLNDKK